MRPKDFEEARVSRKRREQSISSPASQQCGFICVTISHGRKREKDEKEEEEEEGGYRFRAISLSSFHDESRRGLQRRRKVRPQAVLTTLPSFAFPAWVNNSHCHGGNVAPLWVELCLGAVHGDTYAQCFERCFLLQGSGTEVWGRQHFGHLLFLHSFKSFSFVDKWAITLRYCHLTCSAQNRKVGTSPCRETEVQMFRTESWSI